MKVSLLCATEDCLSCVQQPRTDFFGFLLGNKKLGVVDTIMLQTRRLKFKRKYPGTSLVVQGLGLCASTAGGTGLIPGPGTKIP